MSFTLTVESDLPNTPRGQKHPCALAFRWGQVLISLCLWGPVHVILAVFSPWFIHLLFKCLSLPPDDALLWEETLLHLSAPSTSQCLARTRCSSCVSWMVACHWLHGIPFPEQTAKPSSRTLILVRNKDWFQNLKSQGCPGSCHSWI